MSACYTPLPSEALLHISGPDSLTFLQGQTTCDTRRITPTQALPGAYCNVQGRMVCDFLLLQLAQEHYALRLRADVLERAAATFGKYIVFSKAELSASEGDWQVFGCWGDTVAEELRSLGLSTPAARYEATSGAAYVLVQMDEAGCQFELYLKRAEQAALAGDLEAALQRCPEKHWQALQISAGIGRVEGPNVEQFLPQMLNYDLTGHVSFNKGCYTGQEIVARLHYRGKAKRRLYLGQLAAETEIRAGDSLFSQDGGQNVGTVVNAAEVDSQTLCLLTASEQGVAAGLRLASPDGPAVSLQPLPYPVDESR